MTKQALPKWTEERTDTLKSIVGETTPVTQETVAQAAATLKTTNRSVAAKLRKIDYKVESSAIATSKKYTELEEAEIVAFLNSSPNEFTYAEIATQILKGSRSAKQIQGKILSMDLTTLVKATEQVERPKSYTDDEQAKLEALLESEEFIEDIAAKMNREVPSIRGKILSMMKANPSITIPKKRTYVTKKEDPFEALGDVSEMEVADIATAIDKTERGVKTILTKRGVSCKNYDGAKRHQKNVELKEAA